MEEAKRVKRTAIPVLPEELLLWDILFGLPAKDLLRRGAVCRSWRHLSTDPEFLLARHRRQPSLPLVFFHARNYLDTVYVHGAVDAFDIRRTPAVRRPVLAFNDYTTTPGATVHASCDGLLLLSLANHRFYLCNPATRQWCALPDLTGGNVAALYPHRPSGEYRILYWKHTGCSNGSPFYHVLTVSSTGGQRCIGLPLASPSMEKQNARSKWFIRACKHPPVLLHDCLHWHLGSDIFDGKVMVFDTVVESFRLMQSPMANRSVHLLEMDGTLGISHIDYYDTTMAELWVLQDYSMEAWSLKYRTELTVAEMRKDFLHEVPALSGKVVSENGDMLVTSAGLCYPNLFHCDINGKLLEKYKWQDAVPRVLGLCFKESLIRHAFFQRKYGRRGRVPHFIRGL